MKDLEKAIEYYARALALTSDDHPELPVWHDNLGAMYRDKYNCLGQLADLDKSMELFSLALELTPNDNLDSPIRYANLGVSYSDRYRRLGKVTDLEKAIEHKRHALALSSDGHPNIPAWYSNLGVSYNDRYRRLGELGDLEKPIDCFSRALSLTPNGHPDLPCRHTNIGIAYSERYKRLGKLSDLEEAIEYYSHAVTLTPKDHPDLPRRHADLGMSYNERHRRLSEFDDLMKSIQCMSDALELTPEDHPDLADRHADLAGSYGDLYVCLGNLSDLEKAIECSYRALTLTPDGHPGLSLRHFNYAVSLHHRYQHTGDSYHLNTTLEYFRKSSQLLNGAPRDVFDSALRWAKLASEHSYLNPIEAFRTTIDLLPYFIWLGATASQRYQDLSLADNLAVRAAFAAIQSSNYNLALEWLEHARCIVWNQSLVLRSPLDVLKVSHSDLAIQLQSIAYQLHHASTLSPASCENSSSKNDSEHRHFLAREYNKLLAQAREQPGFEGFLQAPKLNDLIKAAKIGPIIVINCYDVHCDALVILPGESHVGHVALPNFSEQEARHARSEIEQLLRQKGVRERGMILREPRRHASRKDPNIGPILASLWYNVVKPILDFLGYMGNNTLENLPHITWCPTGAMSFLPLHAAGDYNNPHSKVFEYVISSFTPTLAALLASTPTVLRDSPKILAIGQPATPRLTPLPGTARELEYVKSHTTGRASYLQLIGEEATTTTVLDTMEKYDWVHLACHAHQNVEDPTKSGFRLHNGTLDLSSINQRSLTNKGLAFLSACQTATGDEALPDEAIHLASGMLMAGYQSVIATMWSVVDDDAPFVADKVYAQLMQDKKIGNGEAGKALHQAVAGLREKVGEKEYSRWVPYIHIGS
ncbi:unnamed protein product [Rhizoctonia solani]|uniref:CHAT domain-containing protein n=1 Tax=Rhizoctonia solani TaxID=456999 RepID=A0A8H2WUV8_9AGAM|nr:unnamed protein product [Rhizoctonia solani]